MVQILDIVLDRHPDPLVLLDARRRVVYANQAAGGLLEISAKSQDLALSLRHPHALEAVDNVLADGGRREAEINLAAPVRRTLQFQAIALTDEAALPTPGSKPDATPVVMIVLTDLTAAKRAEQMRADFVANASHELRSPLSALLGFIETLKGPAGSSTQDRERFLAIMLREARRMAGLIDDLLSLSRVEQNEHVQPNDAVSLKDLLTNLAEALTPQAEARDMTILIERPDDLPAIRGDGDQLFQVFRNLIENAIRYGREGTAVAITAKTVDRLRETGTPGVSVAVRDQGEGIPEETIPRLTERFYRVDEARSKSLGGTGLGLAIVKHIVNRHRGQLAIDSALGEGSTFTVFLPVKGDPGAPEGRPDSG